MRKSLFAVLVLLIIALCTSEASYQSKDYPSKGPIRLHPENNHYFLYRGKPTVLITSAEHYGAVINLDFDYSKYLNTLAESGMNYTRIFTGTYFEIPGKSFSIKYNTLAPEKNKLITPWLTVEGGKDGKVLYDLSKWNDAYFIRLKDFISQAAEKNIIVELTLFSSIYRDFHWDISPQNPLNNINFNHDLSRFDAQTLDNGPLLGFQISFVQKMIHELNEYDNFFFEIQNEPWSDHTVPVYNLVNKEELKAGDWTYKADFADERSMAWQEKIASVIVDAEKKLPKKHLIAQNYTNFKAPVPVVGENISILNFHYAWPEAVDWNYHYNKVIGFDESGFAGTGDLVYRRQAWQFMLSGGGLFNNLDYSFFPGHEDGLGKNEAPGGGSDSLRQQLKILSEFIHSLELAKLTPDKTSVHGSPGLIPYMLSDKKNIYAVYLRAVGTKRTRLQLMVPEGKYKIQFLNTVSGIYSQERILQTKKGILDIEVLIPEEELALKIFKTN